MLSHKNRMAAHRRLSAIVTHAGRDQTPLQQIVAMLQHGLQTSTLQIGAVLRLQPKSAAKAALRQRSKQLIQVAHAARNHDSQCRPTQDPAIYDRPPCGACCRLRNFQMPKSFLKSDALCHPSGLTSPNAKGLITIGRVAIRLPSPEPTAETLPSTSRTERSWSVTLRTALQPETHLLADRFHGTADATRTGWTRPRAGLP